MPPSSNNRRGNMGRKNHPYRHPRPSANANSTNANAASPALQSKRPTGNDEAMLDTPKIMDMQRLYSTSAGAMQPKPFSSLGGTLDKSLLESLDKMGFESMSPVQQKVLTELPSLSSDCLVQAKTGTGKTAAFLLPAIQNLLDGNRPARGKVGILVICPTRELALQIAKECDGITACLPRKMECHTAFGGTRRDQMLGKLMKGDPTIVVATPGRLDDILSEEEVRDKFDSLKTLVLDEADRMLDIGFAPAINSILRKLPRKSDGWQGMCFSATFPETVNDIVQRVLFPGYTTLSTVDANEAPTIDRVPQYSVIVPTASDTFPALLALIEAEYNQNPTDFKAIVFGTTANGVGVMFDMYKNALPQFKVFELHSRMTQNRRTSTTNEFKAASTGILFASDVVGRGMDFPNVGLVIQVGLPSSTEQYVHRVGRTARAGKDGRAVILLSQNEAFFIKINPMLPIKPYSSDPTSNLEPFQRRVGQAFTYVEEEAKAKAYVAFLGFNKTFLKKLKMDTKELVKISNEYAMAMGCPEPPLIEKKTVGKMGLKGVPGLRIGQRN